jgi:hypothetical protein
MATLSVAAASASETAMASTSTTLPAIKPCPTCVKKKGTTRASHTLQQEAKAAPAINYQSMSISSSILATVTDLFISNV